MRWGWAVAVAGAGATVAGAAALLTDSGTAPACGTERWGVKTLQDAPTLQSPVLASIANLRALVPPRVTPMLPRQVAESATYTLTARLVGAKLETDSDIHVVLSDGAQTMIAEFPDPACVGAGASPPERAAMGSARAAFVTACGQPTATFRHLQGLADLMGVAFFDTLHGQAGAARNGIELHPVLAVVISSCARRWRE